MPRYKAIIEYDGTAYYGFQIQHNDNTIAKALNSAIYNFSRETIKIVGSGRTDSGVHATNQVIHFDLTKYYKSYQITSGLNFHLKNEKISIIKAQKTKPDFHSRFHAKERIYEYFILNRNAPPILEKNRCLHIKPNLNIKNMRLAAKLLIGTHDFTSFRNIDCQAKSPIKTIKLITISKKNQMIKITIAAQSFLYNQVRIITGTLIQVGLGKLQISDINDILEKKNRKYAAQTAQPFGLYLVKVIY